MRREPRQPRSKQMVERIIAAGHEVLLERGYEATTTNHIAAAAEISPGSLYRYFPDKNAIVDRVIDRYAAELSARMSRAFLSALGSRSREAVRMTATALLDACEENPGLLRVLIEQVPRSNDSARATFAHRMDDMMAAAILSYPGRDPARPVDVISWILVRTVEHVTISYVLERPPLDRATVIDELTELITGYLNHRPRASGT
jgi:AcrR family transcriptional regulator